MSATSITFRTRESEFHKLESNLIEQGDKYVLYREFMLGDGVDSKRIDFLMQYLDLLCNYNCDLDNVIEVRLKNLEGIECNTRLDISSELSILSEGYYDSLEQGNSHSFLEFILRQVNINSCI